MRSSAFRCAPAGARHTLGLRDAALLGLGIVLLPDFIVGEDIRQGRLVRLGYPHELQVVYPANRHIAVKVRRFFLFLAERLRP